ncbi:aromatic amino acid exporter YddG [Faunimonas pinastri]|nr:EamA family transporter [Faunimonas pinastri]
MTRASATLIGFSAILMWSLLAVFTAASGTVPPFQLAAMTFAIGGALGVVWIAAGGRWRELRQPLPVWLTGIAGLFGYHALYFTALRNARPVEAGLICYLWPLLIVLFSSLLPGERLRWYHIAGALLGLAGTVLIIGGRASATGFGGGNLLGYGSALAAAFTWAAYSVLSRRFAAVPTAVVAAFCLATALLSALCHMLFEITVWPQGGGQWLAILGLGALPVGAAFYVWDFGVKRGNIQVLGAASYVAPLLSTLILILAGFGQVTAALAVAALLISAGAVLASRDMLIRKRAAEPAATTA